MKPVKKTNKITIIVKTVIMGFLMVDMGAFAAAKDSTFINIQVIHHQPQQKIKLTGTITSNTLHKIELDKLRQGQATKKPIELGSFGIHSNIKGICHLDFHSINQFRLKHSSIPDRYITGYQLSLNHRKIGRYKKTIFESGCNFDSKVINMHILKNYRKHHNNDKNAGYYWDTIMITITAP